MHDSEGSRGRPLAGRALDVVAAAAARQVATSSAAVPSSPSVLSEAEQMIDHMEQEPPVGWASGPLGAVQAADQ